jgi:hypothetical protein
MKDFQPEGEVQMAKKMKNARPTPGKKLKGKREATQRTPVVRGRFAAHLASATLLSSPVGPPQPFSTSASASGNDDGHSTTTGLQGTLQKFDDGSVVIDATEMLTADRAGGMHGSLTASCRRVQRGDATTVHQVNYSYKSRVLSDSTLLTNVSDFSLPVPDGYQVTSVRPVKATQFGKNDHEDEGTGSPDMGLIQTNSEVFGGSVKISVMATIFGTSWKTNTKRMAAMIDILFPDKKRMVRVPLVDVGPGENAPSHAEVDLTWACDQFLGTQGGATVQYRILIPS